MCRVFKSYDDCCDGSPLFTGSYEDCVKFISRQRRLKSPWAWDIMASSGRLLSYVC